MVARSSFKRFKFFALTALFPIVIFAGGIEYATYTTGDEQLGGAGGVQETGKNAFSLPSTLLSDEKQTQFFVGNSFFKKPWVEAPSSTEARDGLGPHFIAQSCAGCHTMDGRGGLPDFEKNISTEQPMGLLLRLSTLNAKGEVVPDPVYGDQFNNRAIPDVKPEGEVEISYLEQPGKFADGQPYSLRVPTYRFVSLNYGPMSSNVMVSPRIAQQVIGLGLLEAIDEKDILANAARQQSEGVIKAGMPNYVMDATSRKKMIGRFGWKANVATVAHQSAAAFHGDMGITSALFPYETCSSTQIDCVQSPSGAPKGKPEIDQRKMNQVVLYTRSLAVPEQRDANEPLTLRGKQIFREALCASCHVELYTTRNIKGFPEFSNQRISPFTDLLLHDMGEGLADNRPDGLANGRQWRTAPLWGIGLFQAVSGFSLYLHDGRARDLSEAILWHGGDAAKSRDQFINMNATDRAALLHFLNTL